MKNKFKTAIVLFAVLTGMLLADCAMAQEKGVRVKVGADFVSSYIWRGSYNANASIQPTLGMTAGDFSLTAWPTLPGTTRKPT